MEQTTALRQTNTTTQLPDSSSVPLLATKLSIPALRPGWVSRPRLTNHLHQDCRLALVVAPAGWGKSSAVSEWCAQQPGGSRSVAWVSLDTGDNDPTRFLLYITAACDRAQPGLGETTRNLLQSPQPPSPEVALTVLLNEISTLDRPLTLILDDYHVIEAPPVQAATAFLLEHLPPMLRLVIATRLDPPLPLSRLRVRGQLVEIRANALRFTQSEASTFLNEVMGLDLDANAVARLEARTEGWIAGLQLAAISLQGRANPVEFLDSFSGSNRYIVDYLLDEVLACQPERIQSFLTETSLLKRLCGALCEAVTDQPGGQALLAQLETANLFLIPLDEERRWYRYHHLFADVLQARLLQQRGEQIADLHGRAATWYAQQGFGEEAVFHALAGGHLEQAAHLIEHNGQIVWERGEHYTLAEWLKALPMEMIRQRPLLCVHQAIYYLYQLKIRAAEELLDGCPFDGRNGTEQERDMQGRLLTTRGLLTRLTNDLKASATCLNEALNLLAPDNASWLAATHLNLGLLHFQANRLQEADASYLAAIAECRTPATFYIRIMATVTRAQMREAQGALREAGDLYHALLQMATEGKTLQLTEINLVYAGLTRLHYQWNDLPAALACLSESRSRKGSVLLDGAFIDAVRLKSALGDTEGAAAALSELEAIAQQSDHLGLKSAVEMLRVRMQPQNAEIAQAWLAQYEERETGGPSMGLPIQGLREQEILTWAECRTALGDAATVIPRLAAIVESLTEHKRAGEAVEIRAFLAALLQREGKLEQAIAVLEPALTLAAREGYVRAFLDAGRSLIPVLRQAAAQGKEPEYVAKLLDAFRAAGMLRAEAQTSDTFPPVSSLSERELEVLRLVAAGLSNPEIAEHLFLSVGTIKRHVYNIYSKLEVTGRVEAVTRARELNLL